MSLGNTLSLLRRPGAQDHQGRPPERGSREPAFGSLVRGGEGGTQPLIVIFTVLRLTLDDESLLVTTTVATNLLRARRAFLMALRVFLVNFTLTVLAFPGWRVREAFLPLNETRRTICAFFLLEALTCLTVAATLMAQA